MEFTLFGKRIIIKKEWKTAVVATWVIGLMAHAYRFFNFLPIWDSMFNFQGVGDTFYLGRWGLHYAGLLSSKFDLPWVNGMLSLCYISLTMILIVELFEMSDTLLIVLTAGVFVSFPTVVASFAYMYTADPYMLAFLLATASVYLVWRFPKRGIVVAMLCLCLSMGTYQAYVGTAVILVLLLIVKQFAFEHINFMQAVRRDWKYPVMLVGGAVLYFLAQKIFMVRLNYELSSYQGVNAMGVMSFGEYKQALKRSVLQFLELLGLKDGFDRQIYTEIHFLLLGLFAALSLYFVIKKKLYQKPLELAASVAAVCLLPVGAFLINFTSPYVTYHTLMEMGVCFFYLLLLLLLQQLNGKERVERFLRGCGIAAVCLLLYHNVVNSNIAYYHLNLSYHKSYAIAANLLDRMENLSEFGAVTTKVAIIGDYDAETMDLPALKPDIVGISNQSFLNVPYHYVSLWNYCFGVQTCVATAEELEAVRASEEFYNMPLYPAKESVRYFEAREYNGSYIDSMIVIRMPE